MKKNNYSAFTLIEILVVIVVLTILALGASKINFNAIGEKHSLDKNIVKITSQIETIRNNSLLGKGIGNNLEVPGKYEIHISNVGTGSIKYYYNTGGLDINYNAYKNIKFGPKVEHIIRIKCLDLLKPHVINDTIASGTGIILIEGPNMSLSGACNKPEHKILEVTLMRRNFLRKIKINTLNGIIEIKKR